MGESHSPGEWDVIVVGAGLAGLQCATTLSELRPDLRICLMDGQDETGGSARWAVGSFTAGGTKWQARAGIGDSTSEHYEELVGMCGLDPGAADGARHRALLRGMCAAGPAMLEELEARGVRFAGPFLEAPHSRPRMHNVVPRASAVAEALEAAVRQAGVTILTGAAGDMVDIGRQADGGLAVRTQSGPHRGAAVVLASGDTSATHPVVPGVNPGSLGGPMRLAAAKLGARVHRARLVPGLRTTSPGKAFVAPAGELVSRGSFVLPHGERQRGDAVLADLEAFAGQDLYLEVDLKAVPADLQVCTYPAQGYGTMPDLVRDGLAVAVAGEGGAPSVAIGPMRVLVTLADGGLDVRESMQVLSADGTPVEGVYSCGSAALGRIRLGGHGHHLLWAVFSGAVAARTLAGRR